MKEFTLFEHWAEGFKAKYKGCSFNRKELIAHYVKENNLNWDCDIFYDYYISWLTHNNKAGV